MDDEKKRGEQVQTPTEIDHTNGVKAHQNDRNPTHQATAVWKPPRLSLPLSSNPEDPQLWITLRQARNHSQLLRTPQTQLRRHHLQVGLQVSMLITIEEAQPPDLSPCH